MTDWIALRSRELSRQKRQTLSFWRRLGRSNRWFPRKLTVTREGKWIIGIALLLGAGAVNTGNNLLYLVLSLTISVIAVSGILSEWGLRDLIVTRHYPSMITLGVATHVRLEVQNDKRRAALHVEVNELVDGDDLAVRPGYVLHLAAHEIAQAFATVRAKRRGPIATVGLEVATAYPFGFARKARLHEAPAYFLALPTVADVELPWRGAVQRGALHTSQQVGHGDNFRGLRDARVGDALRDIHWKVSARRDRLIAREWEAEANRVALVRFVNVAPGPSDDVRTLDAACNTVAGLCAALLKDGLAVALQTLQGFVPAAIDPSGDGEQLQQIRYHLAHLVLADRRPPADWAVADADWATLSDATQQTARKIAAGDALAWPGGAPLASEIFVVQFASRADVAVVGHADVQVTLQPLGSIEQIVRVADRAQAGAA